MKNYYTTLDLSKNCDSKEIRKAYRTLSLQWHPDINDSPQAHDKFIEINEAYQVLKDPIKRKKYDYLLSNPSPNNHRRQTRYEDTVRRQSTKGQRRGKHQAQYSETEYKKKQRQSDRTYNGGIVLRVIWYFFEFLFEIIARIVFEIIAVLFD